MKNADQHLNKNKETTTMRDWVFRFLRFLHIMKAAPPPAPQLEATKGTSSDGPLILPVFREPPTPDRDDHLTIDFINASGELMDFECGHRDHRYFEMSLYGKVLKPPGDVPPQFCRECGREGVKHDQRCCLCGSHMCPGDAFILYPAPNPDRTWHAPYIEVSGGRQYLGCLGWECSDNACGGASYAGNLTRKGAKLLFGGKSAIQVAYENPGQEIVVTT